MSDLIGKECVYRPLFDKEVKGSVVVSVEEFVNEGGQSIRMATLENGDVEPVTSLYFSATASGHNLRGRTIVAEEKAPAFKKFMADIGLNSKQALMLAQAMVLEDRVEALSSDDSVVQSVR